MIKHPNQSGFTAVELLITLFIAAAFLMSGYQLYSLIIKDGGESRMQARASNAVYDYLQQYKTNATTPCTAQEPLTDSPQTIAGLPNVTLSVSISCPYPAMTSVSKINVILKYGNPQQEVGNATYVQSGSGGEVTITSGLIGWWNFNGNATASAGSVNGTVTGATPTTSRDGKSNSAYSFNGTNNYIRIPLTELPASMNAISIAFWAKPIAAKATSVILGNPDVTTNRFNIHLPWTDNTIYWDFGNSTAGGRVYTAFSPSWFNVWGQYVFTSDPSSGMAIYRDGVSIASSPTSSTFARNSINMDVGYYVSGNSYWNGSVDDLRIYNRALSAPEIAQLYNKGPL